MKITSLLVLFWVFSAQAHQLSTGFLNAEIDAKGHLIGDLQIRLYDLERIIGLDQDNNGNLTWGETLYRLDKIKAWASHSLTMSNKQGTCALDFNGPVQVDSHFNEGYLLIPVQTNCPQTGAFTVNYTGVFSTDSEHKLLLNIDSSEHSISRILSSSQQQVELNIHKSSALATFVEYIKQGVIHIWIGLDHVLFLMCLLFASIIHAKKNQLNKLKVKEIVFTILGIITTFTLAHSITLTATTFEWITLSSRWIEVSIAITVLLTAFNNVIPLVTRLTGITFAFGLLHGMGFASVLTEIGLPANQQFLSILAFNVGVELGQIAIIVLSLPLLIALKNTSQYANHCLKASSGLIAILAVFWIQERLEYLPLP